MSKILLWRTHYSPLGRGIIQVNDYDPKSTKQVLNLADLVIKYNLKQVFVVDSSLAGILPIYKTLEDIGVSLVFGFLIHFVNNGEDKSEDSNISAHKNIIFVKNIAGYKKMISISTKAHTDFFHEFPRLDYNYFHQIYTEDLSLAIPFYDSFLFKNSMTEQQCVPDFRKIKPTFFVEDNGLPFDAPLASLVNRYAIAEGCEVVEAQTILYETRDDVLAYQARRLMNRKGGKANTIENPNLSHFGSDAFCLEK